MSTDDTTPAPAVESNLDGREAIAPESPSCTGCATRLPSDLVAKLQCGCSYCSECLNRVFRCALKDEEMWPPSCCGMRVRLKLASPHISKDLLKEFKSKRLELSTVNKTYCWKPRCSAFIAPHSIHNGQAICQKCRAVTCSECREKWHFGPCSTDSDESPFFKLVREKKFKKCPACKRMVEKNGGCNHVICRCGAEMCYGCGEKAHRCVCTGDEEDESEEEMGCAIFD